LRSAVSLSTVKHRLEHEHAVYMNMPYISAYRLRFCSAAVRADKILVQVWTLSLPCWHMLAMSWERLSCPGFNATWEGLPALSDQLLRKAWPMAEGTWPIGKLWWCLLAQTLLKWCWNMLNVGFTWFHCLCFTLCDRR
jgi:hypothetical protein